VEVEFRRLLEEHGRILHRVAGAYCRHPEDRRDLVQEIAAQLWRSFPRYDRRLRFSTWAYRIALNVAISSVRDAARRVRADVPLDEEVAAAPEIVDDDARRLMELVRALPEIDRAIVTLYLDGCSHDEIGDVLGMTAGNAATRLHRIKDRLKKEAEKNDAR
jgi:RNA polymerase sigma-70 factor (ECF subfamily)